MTIKVFDFFSGCGGTSKGFEASGMEIMWAIDNDKDAAATFIRNFPNIHFEQRDITLTPIEILEPFIEKIGNHPILFTGCAPCQPFSSQNRYDKPEDSRKLLIEYFGRFVDYYLPDYIFVENVPGLQRANPEEGSPFGSFLDILDKNQYHHKREVINAVAYGVPQKRKRLVLIASKHSEIKFPPKTHGPGTPHPSYATVRDTIWDFPVLKAGQTDPQLPNHQAADLAPINLKRLQATPPGGGRTDWPDEIKLACHTNHDGHTDVYGRMSWDAPASCLTTKCTSISNGRFGHPEQDRAISAREAASLQTFPENFIFEGGLQSISRQIGNAVPVLLAKRFGQNFINHHKRVTYTEEALNG